MLTMKNIYRALVITACGIMIAAFSPVIFASTDDFEKQVEDYIQSFPYQVRTAFGDKLGDTKLLICQLRLGEGDKLVAVTRLVQEEENGNGAAETPSEAEARPEAESPDAPESSSEASEDESDGGDTAPDEENPAGE